MSRRGSAGFTLVEVIVAVVVGGILILGFGAMTRSMRIINARSQDMIVLNSLVEDKIEELRSNSFVALSDGTYDFTNELPALINGPRSATYEVSTLTGTPSIKEIVVEISYQDHGSTEEYVYKTYIGELGVGQY